ncbi:MAG: hypothetical protein EPO28_06240 [Saprospiraceae bacterium]|nr:MAG: hypothetical protein EPO28_06240 [Saprospiraceae bacterium]
MSSTPRTRNCAGTSSYAYGRKSVRFEARRNATTAQIALAWVLAQKPWIVPIPGTTKLYRLAENIGAAAIELTAAELQEMEAASAQIKVVGTRYTEQMESATGL